WNNNLWSDPANQLFKLGATWMARNVDEMRAIRNYLDALFGQQINYAPDCFFISRNGASRIDHPVARCKRHLGVLPFGNARKRGAWLPLAAGAERDDLVRRQIAISIDGLEILHALKVTGFPGDLHNAFHSTPNHNYLAASGPRGISNSPKTPNV